VELPASRHPNRFLSARVGSGSVFFLDEGVDDEDARQERGAEGSPTASGTATITLYVTKGTVCWKFTVKGLDTVNASHIHKGPKSKSGNVVVPLSGKLKTSGRVAPSKATVAAIQKEPHGLLRQHPHEQVPGRRHPRAALARLAAGERSPRHQSLECTARPVREAGFRGGSDRTGTILVEQHRASSTR
jgi:CHRD domain